jgi:hypothetical protein
VAIATTNASEFFGRVRTPRAGVKEDMETDPDDDKGPLSARGIWTRKGQRRPLPMPSTGDLARSLGALEHTLSEVLALLYQVVQTNESLMELLHREGILPLPPTGGPAPRRETPNL